MAWEPEKDPQRQPNQPRRASRRNTIYMNPEEREVFQDGDACGYACGLQRESTDTETDRYRKMLVKVFHVEGKKNHEERGKVKVVQGDWSMEWEAEVTQANVNLGRASLGQIQDSLLVSEDNRMLYFRTQVII